MKRALNWIAPVLVGFLIGALVSMGSPVRAKDASGPRALARKMLLLEERVTQIELAAAESALGVEARLQELEKMTQLLDHDGSYVGYVDSVQIWSNYCQDGAAAVWVDYEGYPELSCEASSADAPPRLDMQSLKENPAAAQR